MSLLMIGPAEKTLIARLIEKAEGNVISYDRMVAATKSRVPLPVFQDLTISIPIGYSVTFSIEEHLPGVAHRHFSMSTSAAKKVPSPDAVAMIIKEFGFVRSLFECHSYVEKSPEGISAINVIEEMPKQVARTN